MLAPILPSPIIPSCISAPLLKTNCKIRWGQCTTWVIAVRNDSMAGSTPCPVAKIDDPAQVRSPLPPLRAAQLHHQCLHPLPIHSRVSSARSFAKLVGSWATWTSGNADVQKPGVDSHDQSLVDLGENLLQYVRK